MCINFNGYHSGGSSFLNVNDCWLKKKKKKKSQYMVSHLETGSDSPIGSDRDRGCDTISVNLNLAPIHHMSWIWSILPKHGDVKYLVDT